VKTSFRKSGVSKIVKRKLDALFRVETKNQTRQDISGRSRYLLVSDGTAPELVLL